MQRPKHRWHSRAVFALAALIYVAGAGAAAQDRQPLQSDGEKKGGAKWLRFSPASASFSLLLPDKPSGSGKDYNSGMRAETFKVKTGSTEYQIVWLTNVPQQILSQGPLNVLFPRGLEGILKSARQAGQKDLVTTHEEDIKLNGYQGRESTMESANTSIQARGFIAGHDFIALAVMHAKEESAVADAKRFLESLLLPDPRLVSSIQESPAAGTVTGTYAGSEVDTRPVALNRPRPEYTDKARNHGVQGTVRIRALIEGDGSVKDLRLVTHLPDGLDEAAIKAVRKMRFKPATKGGQPVAFWQMLEVEFNLRRGW